MVFQEVSFFLACVGLVLISLEVHEVNAEYNCEYKKDGFYADDDFCHIYWRCNYGVAEEYECPAGTAWNHLESRCDWLDNVDCTRVKNKEESGEKDEEDKDLMSDDETTKKSKKSKKTTTEREEQQHSITTTNESPDDVTDHKIADLFTSSSDKPNSNTNSNPNALCQPFGSYYIPDNSNCMSYYFCNNGVETKMTCTDKKLFNSETSQCEDYQHVFCANRPVNMADRNQCTGKRDGIYPDIERTCRVFYQCINQVKIREASCPSILRFNSISGKCDNPINIIAPCGTIGAVNEAAGSSIFTQQSAMFLALVVLLFSTVFLL